MKKALLVLLLVSLISGAYLYALPAATIFYAAVVVLHLVAGGLLAATLLVWLLRGLRGLAVEARPGWLLLTAGAALGLALIFLGTPRRLEGWLYAHIGLSLAGCLVLAASARKRGWLGSRGHAARYALLLVLTAVLGGAAWWAREVRWQRSYSIRNPPMPPATMDGEGDGPAGPFFPSASQTAHGGKIPAKFFMQSNACQR